MSEPDQNLAIDFELDVPDEDVLQAELDLIEAHFSPLIRQLLTEIALSEK